MSAEQNKALIRTWVEEVWHKGNNAFIAQAMSPDYVMHDANAGDVHGREGFTQFRDMFVGAFPDLRHTIEDMVAEGDKVVWRIKSVGTNRGELMGIPPTGRGISISVIIISRFENGKFAEDDLVVDMLSMLQQLGIVPATGAAVPA